MSPDLNPFAQRLQELEAAAEELRNSLLIQQAHAAHLAQAYQQTKASLRLLKDVRATVKGHISTHLEAPQTEDNHVRVFQEILKSLP